MIPQPLTREEAKKLLDACPATDAGIRDRALFALLYRGAMRIGATLRLRPADFDWDRKLVTIQKDKGGKGRTVSLDNQVVDILRIWAERRKSLGVNGHHPFFCAIQGDARGNSINPSHYRRRIKRLQEKAGIERRCHLHGFRHTAASELLEEGFDIATIARQLGHKYASTTSQYIHQLRPDLMDEKLKERVW